MRTLTLAAVLAATVLLSGCVPQSEPPPEPSPDASVEPVFASDEEALAAAEAAYVEYWRVFDEAFKSGSPAHLADVADGDALATATESVADFVESGHTQVGFTKVEDVELVNHDRQSWIQIYACVNVSQIDILGSDGNSVVRPGRLDRFPFIADLVMSESGLRVTSDELWDGRNFCA